MIRRRTLTLFVVVCLGHVLLISAQVQSKSGLPVIEAAAFGVFAGAQRVTAGIADTISSGWTNYFALRGAAGENAALRQQILDLQAVVQSQQASVARTKSLQDALGIKERIPEALVVAEVIAGNPSPGALTVTINRGTSDGIGPDMAVIGARGVVGRVIKPIAPFAATVQLLVGRSAGVAVAFERSGAGGVAMGGEYVPVLADVQTGEKVTTSSQDGIYPGGFLVGTVERVSRTGGPDREIAIRPVVDFSHIDIVLVFVAKPVTPLPAGSQP
jgi:rod shape-determining protein MreC